MAFLQIIEITTSRIDEVERLMNEWMAATQGKRAAHRSTLTTDRDQPNTYVQIVEFPSYESAMSNSDLAETADFAKNLGDLCESPPSFRNLDVRRVDELT